MVLLANSNGRGGGDLIAYTKEHDPKTYEPIYSKKERAWQDAIDAVSGRWAGDEIVIQGDYAKNTDPAYITEEQFKDFKDITPLVEKALRPACPEEFEREDILQGKITKARRRA